RGQTKSDTHALEGTGRIEAFSDGVIAIIVTILILEIKVPHITDLTNQGAWTALKLVFPKLLGFLASFITVSIFWVNHHHFFHSVEKSDGKLLWYNNLVLFWLAVVPFVTAFIGDYSEVPVAVALYGFVLCMAAIAFNLMIRYVFFHSNLLPEKFSMMERQTQYKRSWTGVVLYGASVPLAFVHPVVAMSLFVITPIYYFLPRRIGGGGE
ncbi:TMEM175 family protein, partial [Patescibacteria group bacterium]|nr:TMEM175 family protein [Patescibacteria group bacterium]